MAQHGFVFVLLLIGAMASAKSTPLSLQDKLDAQWQLYSDAQRDLLQQIQNPDLQPQQKIISRDKWEAMLTLPAASALTAQDLSDLTASQQQRIAQAKIQNRENSAIDLDMIRNPALARNFCAQVPKGGMLHIHPGGTVDRATASSLLQSLNPQLDITGVLQDLDATKGNSILFADERTWLQSVPQNSNYLSLNPADQSHFASFLFLPAGKQPFARFNSVFEFLDFVIPDWNSYDTVLLNFAQKAAAEGVSYVEFTSDSSPAFFQHVAVLEQKTGLVIRINNSFNRTDDAVTLSQELAKFLAAPSDPHLVGIDFLDNEDGNPALEKGQLLYGGLLSANRLGTSQLHRTMHAGEIGDIRNPRDAMILGAERLGHGVNLAKDPVALEYAVKIHEPVEINISSNLRLTDVQSVPTHPFLNYLRLGLPVSLSTDDEGIFDIDINHECEIAVEQTDMSYNEFKQMAMNSIQTSFATSADKKALLAKLTAQFAAFEANYRGKSKSASTNGGRDAEPHHSR